MRGRSDPVRAGRGRVAYNDNTDGQGLRSSRGWVRNCEPIALAIPSWSCHDPRGCEGLSNVQPQRPIRSCVNLLLCGNACSGLGELSENSAGNRKLIHVVLYTRMTMCRHHWHIQVPGLAYSWQGTCQCIRLSVVHAYFSRQVESLPALSVRIQERRSRARNTCQVSISHPALPHEASGFFDRPLGVAATRKCTVVISDLMQATIPGTPAPLTKLGNFETIRIRAHV